MQQPTICKTNPALFCAYTDAGITLFPCVGYSKIPAKKGFLDEPYDLEFVPQENNYGALLKNRYLVIDCDPRHYKDNDKPLTRMLKDLELPSELFKDTFTVKTPRGGYHIYFKKPESVSLVSSLKSYPGLEFKTKFIMAAGSFIDKEPDGTPIMHGYTVRYGSLARMMKCPQILLAKLLQSSTPTIVLDGPITPDNPVDIHAFVQHCVHCPPAIEGENGDLRTYQTACAGREFGLSPEKTFAIMEEHFNPRCIPSWSSEDLRRKVTNAYEYATKTPQGIKSIQASFHPVEKEPRRVEIKYQTNGKGVIKRSMHNLKMFFEFPTLREVDDTKVKKALNIPPIGNYLALNQFSHNIDWRKPAPWFKSSAEWTDEDAIEFKSILSEQLSMDFPTVLIHEVASVCASKRAFHPIRNYIESCIWDGTPRVENWLTTYCKAADNLYTRFVGRKTLIAAVARVFSPGCKFDYVLTLEGAQGIGKSYMWEILTSPWFTDAPLHIQDRSAIEIMRGKWVVELAEMDALTKYESQTIKGFLSRNEDRCRMAYERKAKSFPRQNIFVGSINPEVTGWLKDRTGNRRYWPVAVGKIDLEGLKRARDYIWAEAYQLFQSGEDLRITDQRVQMMMNSEVANRMQEDPWFGLLEEHLHNNAADYLIRGQLTVIPVELYTRYIGGSAAGFKIADANRIASILKILGFEKTRSAGQLGYAYTKKYAEGL